MLQELNSDSKLKTRSRSVSSTGLQNYKALNKITSTYVNINISSLIKKNYPPAPTLLAKPFTNSDIVRRCHTVTDM